AKGEYGRVRQRAGAEPGADPAAGARPAEGESSGAVAGHRPQPGLRDEAARPGRPGGLKGRKRARQESTPEASGRAPGRRAPATRPASLAVPCPAAASSLPPSRYQPGSQPFDSQALRPEIDVRADRFSGSMKERTSCRPRDADAQGTD